MLLTCTVVFAFNEIAPQKLLGNNTKVKEKYFVVSLHSHHKCTLTNYHKFLCWIWISEFRNFTLSCRRCCIELHMDGAEIIKGAKGWITARWHEWQATLQSTQTKLKKQCRSVFGVEVRSLLLIETKFLLSWSVKRAILHSLRKASQNTCGYYSCFYLYFFKHRRIQCE